MKISFDNKKNLTNLEKHGVSLAMARRFEWDEAVLWQDTRNEYGEIRMAGIGYIDLRLYVVVFTDRPDARRIISLRKANKREVKRYAEA